jgi:SAM-dependent methyltransferase
MILDAHPNPIPLINGTIVDLSQLATAELLELWFQEECAYAERLSQLSLDCHDRGRLQRQAYLAVHKFSSAYDRRLDHPVSFGFRPFDGSVLFHECLRDLRDKGRRSDYGVSPVTRLLEIGVGRGDLYRSLCASFQEDGDDRGPGVLGRIQCWGCDLVMDDASRMKPHGDSCDGDGHCPIEVVELREGDLLDLAKFYAGLEGFDIVFWSDVIEHLPRNAVSRYLRTIRQVLRPGGRLITCTPNRLTGPHDVSRFVMPTGKAAMGLHLCEYSHRELRALLASAGFRRFQSPVGVGVPERPRYGSLAGTVKWIVEPSVARLPAPARRHVMDRWSFDIVVCSTPD